MSELYVNLFPVSWNISNGLKVQFNLNKCIVTPCNSEAVVIAIREDILYKINFVKVHELDVANLVQSPSEYDALKLWHRRLGHLSMKDVHTLQNIVSGILPWQISWPTTSLLCEACIKGK